MDEQKKKESGRELAEEELKEVSGGRSASASCDNAPPMNSRKRASASARGAMAAFSPAARCLTADAV